MCDRCTRLIRAGLVVDGGGVVVLTPTGVAVAALLPRTSTRAQIEVALHAAADRHEAGAVLPVYVPGPRRRQ